MLNLFNRIFSKRRREAPDWAETVSIEQVTYTEGFSVVSSTLPDWKPVLTESLSRNCLAPDEATILHAHDLYVDVLHAPMEARELAIANLYSEIAAGFAALRALAPDMIERVMASNPWRFPHMIDHRKEAR